MTFDERYFDLGRIDRLSYRDTVIHRLDPRGKIISTMLFILTVVSYPKYEILSLIPYFIFPVLIMTLSGTPPLFILKKVLIVSPFAIFIGIFNPLLDTASISISGGVQISAGWISFLSIIIKFTLTISSALLLIATTSFPAICGGLNSLGVPAAFTSQLFFLYRYLFVLIEETMRMVRARDLRTFDTGHMGMKVFVRLTGILFIRTVERAERVYGAMLSRGFRGQMPSMKRSIFSVPDAVLVIITILLLCAFRLFDLTETIGRIAQGIAA